MATGSKSTRLPRQAALFDDDSEPNASALVTVAAGTGPLSAEQRTFNRLTERIRRSRELLASWEAFIARFQQRVANELQPIETAIRDTQRRLVLQLQALLSGTENGVRLSRKHRAKVRSLLLLLTDDLLEAGPDPELEALYDSHSDIPYAEQRRQGLELAEDMVGEMFGPEATQGHEAQSVEELLRHAGEKIAEAEARAREAFADRASRRPNPAAERKAQAAREASQSVREVYRKLASALHPDRETDAAERERKTTLMQRANQAYERNDLLELLALQIETEQIDASALASVPEARLRHYNQVLLDQTAVLQAQIEERIAIFRSQFDLTLRDVTPHQVDQALSARIIQARAGLVQIERDLEKLADPQQRPSALDELPDTKDDVTDLEDLVVVAAMFDGRRAYARPAGRRKKKVRRR